MTAVVLHFVLGAALLIGALLTFAGAVGLVENVHIGSETIGDPSLRPFALAIAAFGLLLFIAAASATIAQIATPV